MSILQQLQELSIPLEKVGNLTDKELIRIEKRLKAEVVLKGDSNLNETLKLIDIIKTDGDKLETISHPNFRFLRKIINNPNEIIYFSNNQVPEISFSNEFKLFIHKMFEFELSEYYQTCFKQNNYRAFHSFLLYQKCLPEFFLEEIQDKFIQRMEFAIECIEIEATNLNPKIDHLFNPFFFRCLNSFDKLNQDSQIRRIIQVIFRPAKENMVLYRIYFSMGMYNSLEGDLNKIIESNFYFAMNNGVSEERNLSKYPMGGTQSYRDDYQKGTRSRIMLMTVVITFGIIVLAVFAATLINKSNLTSNKEVVIEKDPLKKMIQDQMSYQQINQYEGLFIGKPIEIFHEDSINIRFTNYYSDFKNRTLVKNNTNKYVMLVLKQGETSYNLVCLKPYSERRTASMIHQYTIYQGLEPVYFSAVYKGANYRGFRFNKFTQADALRFEKIRTNKVRMSSLNYFEFVISNSEVQVTQTDSLK